jgi:hypothetical protein
MVNLKVKFKYVDGKKFLADIRLLRLSEASRSAT